MYEDIEDRLTELLGAPDTLVLATITHIHMSVIPVLAGGGTIFLDRRAHKTIYDGTKVATSNGARVQRYNHDDLDHLEQLLKAAPGGTRLICMDGVNSMTGNAPDLPAFAELAREHDALLYVDDAHGFGVIGERTADEPCNWGSRGNSIVRHFGESYDNVVLVGGFSKSYSSLLAFLALPSRLKNVLKIAAAPYLYSGPSPVASLATVLAGLDVNRRRGDDIRRDLYAKTTRVLDGLDALGVATPNTSGFPIIEIPLPDADQIDDMGRFLFDRGIYVTLAAFPLVPRHEVGFRIQVTAANTTEDIDLLLSVLEEATDRFGLAGAWSGSAVAAGH
jgi:8-amino-7-oxononanoate synthase